MTATSYIKNFLKDRQVASVAPTGKTGIKLIAAKITGQTDEVIVEYGPGDGPITKAILQKLKPTGRLIVIETNIRFVQDLKQINDPRLIIINDRSENIKKILNRLGISQVDCIVSGIPFSLIPPTIANQLLTDTADVLKPGGRLMIYQFRRGVKKILAKHFDHIGQKRIFFNLPPLWLFEAKQPK